MRPLEYLKLGILFAVITAFLLLVGFVLSFYVFGLPVGIVLVMMLGLSILINGVSYLYGTSMMLKFTGARILTPREAPKLFAVAEELSSKAGVARPTLAVTSQQQPNAFTVAKGRGASTIVVTSGLLNTMDDDEVRAVLGHEVGHIIHRDTSLATVAAALATAVTYAVDLATFSLLLGSGRRGATGSLAAVLLAPLGVTMVQLAISRGREYYADEEGAKLTGEPNKLISALRKIESYVGGGVSMNVPQASAGLWIHNPFSGSLGELFSTHPRTDKRIERLRRLAQKAWFTVH